MHKISYPIDKELVKLRNMHLPNNFLLVAAINAYLSFLPTNINKDLVDFKVWKNGDVTMHMFTPFSVKDKVSPCLFYIHGGGFVFKATEVQYHYEQQYAINCNCRVVGIDYHLMPKHVWPVATNDCIEGYKYILENAKELMIDPHSIAIGGDSAGGLLTLESYLGLKEMGTILPKGLMLIYPVVDHTSSTESVQKYIDTPVWDGKSNKLFWKKFLAGQEYTSPLQRAEEYDVENLFVEVEEFDCLHDEGKELYEKVTEKVVGAVLLDNSGTFHAFDANYDATISKKTLKARCDFLKDTWKCGMVIHNRLRGTTMCFKKKTIKKTYDKSIKKPVIKASICNGEQVAGFRDITTGAFEEVMLIKTPDDLALFKETYGISEEIEKIY